MYSIQFLNFKHWHFDSYKEYFLPLEIHLNDQYSYSFEWIGSDGDGHLISSILHDVCNRVEQKAFSNLSPSLTFNSTLPYLGIEFNVASSGNIASIPLSPKLPSSPTVSHNSLTEQYWLFLWLQHTHTHSHILSSSHSPLLPFLSNHNVLLKALLSLSLSLFSFVSLRCGHFV